MDCFLGCSVSCSLPGTPSCAGIHRNSTSHPRFRSSSSACTAFIKIYCPDRHSGFRIAWMAAWLSVNMAHLPGVMSVVCMLSTICSARTTSLRFAAYPLNVADVPCTESISCRYPLAFTYTRHVSRGSYQRYLGGCGALLQEAAIPELRHK